MRFKGRDITGQPPHRVFHLGVGYVPERRQVFPHLDVGENLRLAERAAGDATRWTLDRIFEYFPVLRERSSSIGRQEQHNMRRYVTDEEARNRITYRNSRTEAATALGISDAALKNALWRLAKAGRVASPRRGFYVTGSSRRSAAIVPPRTLMSAGERTRAKKLVRLPRPASK